MSIPVVFHGLSAYNKARSSITLRDRARSVIGAEICVADKAIGDCGVAVSGSISRCFSSDVYSVVKNGRRRVGDTSYYYGEELVNPSHDDFVEFARRNVGTVRRVDYCEAWMTPVRVEWLWVTTGASNRVRRAMRIAAHGMGLQLIEYARDARIWDINVNPYKPYVWPCGSVGPYDDYDLDFQAEQE